MSSFKSSASSLGSSRTSSASSRGSSRTSKCHVTQDTNDSSNELIGSSELIAYLSKRVIHAEMWECPLERRLGAVLQIFGIVHQGIIVTMEDGMKFLVHKMASESENGVGEVVVSRAYNMGKQWSFVNGKDVRWAKLGAYLDECGDKYYLTTDNCKHAAARMWSLQ